MKNKENIKEMKKFLALVSVCVISLTACAGSESTPTTDVDNGYVAEATTVQEDNTETDPAGEEEIIYLDPVIYDFSGTYTEPMSGRCVIDIVSTGENKYSVNVSWSSSAAESAHWEMDATYYESTTLLEYTDAKYYIRTYSDEENFTDEVIYEDGAGEFWFDEDGMLGWRSANSDADYVTGETMFEKLPEE